MASLEVESPDREVIESDWNEFIEYGVSGSDKAIRAEVVGGSKKIRGEELNRIEPQLESLGLWAVFLEGSSDKAINQRDAQKLNRLEAESQGLRNERYFRQYADIVFENDIQINTEYYTLEVKGLAECLSQLEGAEEGMLWHPECEFEKLRFGMGLDGSLEFNSPEELYDELQENLCFEILFLYEGDKKGTEDYAEYDSQNPLSRGRSGYDSVPGVLIFGREEYPVFYTAGDTSIVPEGLRPEDFLGIEIERKEIDEMA